MIKKVVLAGLLLLSLAALATYPKCWTANDNGAAMLLLHPTRDGYFYIENPGPDTITVCLYDSSKKPRTLLFCITLRPHSDIDFYVYAGEAVEIQDVDSNNGIHPRGTWDFP